MIAATRISLGRVPHEPEAELCVYTYDRDTKPIPSSHEGKPYLYMLPFSDVPDVYGTVLSGSLRLATFAASYCPQTTGSHSEWMRFNKFTLPRRQVEFSQVCHLKATAVATMTNGNGFFAVNGSEIRSWFPSRHTRTIALMLEVQSSRDHVDQAVFAFRDVDSKIATQQDEIAHHLTSEEKLTEEEYVTQLNELEFLTKS